MGIKKAHPRSALIIGLSALEAGFKEMVGDLVPHAKWLVENMPSPPMADMLRNYMPKLPSRAMIRGSVPKLSKRSIAIINDGVTLRNKVAHGIKRPINNKHLEELLRTIRSILWVFDLYRGRRWAIDHIDYDILEMVPPQ